MVAGPDGIYWADNTESCIVDQPQGHPRIRRTAPGGSIDVVTGLSFAAGVAIALAVPTPGPVGGIALSSDLAPLPAAE